MSEKEDAPWRDRSRAAVTVNGIDSSNGNGGGPALSHGNGTHRSGDASHHAWPTVWGLDPRDLHDRFWASRGIEVIRPGDSFTDAHEPSREYLLTTSRFLFTFPINRWLRALERLPQRTIALSIRNERSIGCREITVTGDDLQLTRFQRQYDRPDQDLLTVYLTRDPELARKWAKGDGASEAEAMAQAASSRARRITYGHVFDTERQTDVMAFVRHLLQCFTEPGVAIGRTRRLDLEDSVWIDRDCSIPRDTKFIGPVWIGAGREVPPNEWIVGPTVLWDDPAARPVKEPIAWSGLEPVRRDALQSARKKRRPIGPPGKRAFDVLFSLVALALTLPLYPFVLLLIWLEDRRPFFFVHRRQTFGGGEFPCLKFRTMRKDAESLKEKLLRKNEADGPQFFIGDDPRLLRSGKFLRKTQIDELPQFFNVLLGHMSIVGPRPSPFDENQYAPSWREARLTARPGITGLWQVCRTRQQGQDFQEWIRYDIHYVENASWKLDLWIIWRTLVLLGRDLTRVLRALVARPQRPKKDAPPEVGEPSHARPEP